MEPGKSIATLKLPLALVSLSGLVLFSVMLQATTMQIRNDRMMFLTRETLTCMLIAPEANVMDLSC
jgi:hypothetical protein